jgi:hypothetical protein
MEMAVNLKSNDEEEEEGEGEGTDNEDFYTHEDLQMGLHPSSNPTILA